MCREQIWVRLEDRFGSQLIERYLKVKVQYFPKLSGKDNSQLCKLADLVSEIGAVMKNSKYKNVFAYYNSSSGINPIFAKLSVHLQERWTKVANNYKITNNLMYPSFTIFVNVIHNIAKVRNIAKVQNDPSFKYEQLRDKQNENPSSFLNSRKTNMSETSKPSEQKYEKQQCPIITLATI